MQIGGQGVLPGGQSLLEAKSDPTDERLAFGVRNAPAEQRIGVLGAS